MARYFTFHWQQRSWRPDVNSEGKPIGSSGSNVFRQRGVLAGDVIYIVSLIEGYLYLGGKLTVSRIVTRQEAVQIRRNPDLYRANEWVINDDATDTPLNLRRRLAAEVTRKLTHKSGEGFCFKQGTDRLDGQATRGLQEIDEFSAEFLDHIIEITDRMPQATQTVTVTEDLIRELGTG